MTNQEQCPVCPPLAEEVSVPNEVSPPATVLARLRAALVASRRQVGMTLIEIMIVVTIMVSIMGVVGWYVIGQANKANIDLAGTQLKNIKGMVETYRVYYKKFPEKLEDLVNTPDGTKMIEEIPKDPWGNDYIYERSGNKSVKIFSAGPDGTPNNDDDIVVKVGD